MYKYRKKGEKRKQRGNYRFYNNLNDYITINEITVLLSTNQHKVILSCL